MIKEPKTNDITHLCCLITGDRFYFANDSTKQVWELRFHTKIKIRGEFRKLSQCKRDNGIKLKFDANRVVIFLRRTKPIVTRKREFLIDNFFA